MTAEVNLPNWMQYLDSLDWGPGQRDQSSWKAFLRAGSLGLPADVVLPTVAGRVVSTGGSYVSSKLESQIRRAYVFTGSEAGATRALHRPPTPKFSPEKLKALAGRVTGIDIDWLSRRSPVSPTNTTSVQFLQCLYATAEKIVIFTIFESQGQIVYEIGGLWQPPLPEQSADGVWFLVNPVDGESHPNPRQGGRLSRRSEESVTCWRYMVLESDVAESAEWLACLVQLPLRIAAIYTSGGKSIHALVRLDAATKQDWDSQRDAIKPGVVTLGADEGALTAVRLSRLPGTRRGDRPQQLLYLDPHPTGIPIIDGDVSNE